MYRRWLAAVAGLGLLSGSLALAGPMAAGASAGRHTSDAFRPGGLFQPTPGASPFEFAGSEVVYSTNWSGYAVTGATFTTASAHWTQNAISCSSGGGATDMSPWVGIDGYSSRTVEQTGSSGDCNGATPHYYGWYEMYPRNVNIINKTVKPGDLFAATITHTAGESYQLMLQDITENWTNTVTKTISAKDNSAEAVMEMAASHLSNFGANDPFTDFTVDGNPIGSYKGTTPYSVKQMEIKVSGTLCDATSALAAEENFTLKWLNAC